MIQSKTEWRLQGSDNQECSQTALGGSVKLKKKAKVEQKMKWFKLKKEISEDLRERLRQCPWWLCRTARSLGNHSNSGQGDF